MDPNGQGQNQGNTTNEEQFTRPAGAPPAAPEPSFAQPVWNGPTPGSQPKKRTGLKVVGGILLALILIGGAGAGAYAVGHSMDQKKLDDQASQIDAQNQKINSLTAAQVSGTSTNTTATNTNTTGQSKLVLTDWSAYIPYASSEDLYSAIGLRHDTTGNLANTGDTYYYIYSNKFSAACPDNFSGLAIGALDRHKSTEVIKDVMLGDKNQGKTYADYAKATTAAGIYDINGYVYSWQKSEPTCDLTKSAAAEKAFGEAKQAFLADFKNLKSE